MTPGPSEVDIGFWDDPEIREALATRHMGKVIRAYRLHTHHGRNPLTQEHVASWVGMTQAQLSRIENGTAIVHLDRLIQWARLLEVPVDLLWFALPELATTATQDPLGGTGANAQERTGDARMITVSSPGAALTYSSSISTTLDTVTDLVEADVHRRDVLIGVPFLLSALHQPTRDWLLDVLNHVGPTEGDARVSKAKLEQIRTVLNMFAEADAQQGGGHGRQALAQYLRTTVLPMLRGETNENLRRALFDLAGEQSQLLGWMALDTGEYGLSERYLIQALRFSEEAQNPVLGAHTLATLSHLATTLGHADEGVQLAKTGQTALRGASNAMFADLAVLEARSHAMRGDGRSAAIAVHRAEKALRDVVTENELPEMRFIDQAYIAGEIANTLILLDDAPRAIDFARQSIDSSLAQGRARRGALSNVALAQAHLVGRDLDSACAAGTEALRLSQDVDSTRTVDALRTLKKRLAPHAKTRPVINLLDEMNAAAI